MGEVMQTISAPAVVNFESFPRIFGAFVALYL